MNCPRCKAAIGPLESPDSIVTCPGCGTRLMTRSAALRSQGASPQGRAQDAAPPTAPALPPRDAAPSLDPGPTTVSSEPAGAAVKTASRKGAAPASGVTLEMLLAEIEAVRDSQQLILESLGGLRRSLAQGAPVTGASTADGLEEPGGSTLSPIRSRSRKTVVLLDDDEQTRQAAVDELTRAEIPVRAFSDGNKALAAIAEEKPDVIILELAVGGDLGGKDLVNMIKATMEWVDIPIVLWTRDAVSNQREARQIHGADEVVLKTGGAAALVARVITVFRR